MQTTTPPLSLDQQYLSDRELKVMWDEIKVELRTSEYSVQTIADMVQSKIHDSGKECNYLIEDIALCIHKDITGQ